MLISRQPTKYISRRLNSLTFFSIGIQEFYSEKMSSINKKVKWSMQRESYFAKYLNVMVIVLGMLNRPRTSNSSQYICKLSEGKNVYLAKESCFREN